MSFPVPIATCQGLAQGYRLPADTAPLRLAAGYHLLDLDQTPQEAAETTAYLEVILLRVDPAGATCATTQHCRHHGHLN